MKIKNWNLIDEAGSFVKLPVGAYVMRIVGAKSGIANAGEYVELVYDVAEGPFAGHYANDDDWRHTTRQYCDGKSEPFFRAFLNRLEESNRGKFSVNDWTIRCDEREFISLEVGVIMRERMYTNQSGEDKTVLEVGKFIAAQDVRNGDYKLMEPNDQRVKVSPAVSSFVPATDVPF